MTAPAASSVRALTAWQAALAAEHRAYFAYGLLGPHLTGDERTLAADDQTAHATLRDATTAAITAAGGTPVAPLADYPDLYPVGDASAARAVALRVEQDCAAAWRYLFAAVVAGTRSGGRPSASALRAAAQSGLTASAVRASRWRRITDPAHPTVAFPGI